MRPPRCGACHQRPKESFPELHAIVCPARSGRTGRARPVLLAGDLVDRQLDEETDNLTEYVNTARSRGMMISAQPCAHSGSARTSSPMSPGLARSQMGVPPEHGTRARYVSRNFPCREKCCVQANAAYLKVYKQTHPKVRYPKHVKGLAGVAA